MVTYHYLIKPVSSSCDLKCKYCFYHDVSEHRSTANWGIMTEQTMLSIISKALNVENDAMITFAFQGGEPTLIPLTFYENFVAQVKRHKKEKQIIHYAIQTNGYTIDDHWCRFFKKNNFLVGVSLDGYAKNHDYFRLTRKNQGTFKAVMKNIEAFRKYDIDFNILTVLSKPLAKHPEKLYHFYLENDLHYIQLIPCLPGLKQNDDPFALTPKLFAEFYKTFYKLWLEDFKQGKPLSITLFDNLILIFKGIYPSVCGMLGQCQMQYVIEANGDIYPCDFYVLDAYRCGNINRQSLLELKQSKQAVEFLNEIHPSCSLCQNCKFINICHSNCKRLSVTYFNEHYCGYQDFLEANYRSIADIAQRIR